MIRVSLCGSFIFCVTGCANTLVTDHLVAPPIHHTAQNHLIVALARSNAGVHCGVGVTDRIALMGQWSKGDSTYDEFHLLIKNYSAAVGTYHNCSEGVI